MLNQYIVTVAISIEPILNKNACYSRIGYLYIETSFSIPKILTIIEHNRSDFSNLTMGKKIYISMHIDQSILLVVLSKNTNVFVRFIIYANIYIRSTPRSKLAKEQQHCLPTKIFLNYLGIAKNT